MIKLALSNFSIFSLLRGNVVNPIKKRRKNLTIFYLYNQAEPLNDFIEKNYPQAYSKFFNDMLKTRRVSVSKIIETLHPSVDVSQLLNLGINDDHIGPYVPVFTEILRLFNYPVYI